MAAHLFFLVAFFLFLFVSILAPSHVALGQPIPVIIDTDIAQDMDDQWSIAYMVSRPDLFDIKLLVSATKNTTGKAIVAAQFFDYIGRTDIPIGIGVATIPTNYVGPEYIWAQDYSLSKYPGVVYQDGIAAMYDVIMSVPNVTIVELAPVANVLQLLTLYPDIAPLVRVSAMSGAVYVGYENISCAAGGRCIEYNVAENITAAQAVYASSWQTPPYTAPLDTSGLIQILGAQFQRLLDSQNVLVTNLLDAYRVWFANGGGGGGIFPYNPTNGSSTLYDVQAAFMAGNAAILDSFFVVQDLMLSVNAAGQTVIDDQNGKPFRVAVQWAAFDTVGLEAFVDDVVTSLLSFVP